MASKSTSYCVAFVVAGLFALSACSSSSNPAGPSDPTRSNPGNSTVRAGSLSVTAFPNPVPFSGAPVRGVAGCDRRNNTWYYELTLKESGGVPVTLTSQIDAFDGLVVNNLGVKVSVPANGELKLNRRWCSATGGKHTAQHTFSGIDSNGNAVNLQTRVINLMPTTDR